MTRVLPPWSNQQQRHLSFLVEFSSALRHASGSSNVEAYALSHQPTTPGSVSAAAAAVKIKPPAIANAEADLHANNLSTKLLPPADLCSADEHSSSFTPAQPAAFVALDFAAISAAQHSCPNVATMGQSPSLRITSKVYGGAQLHGDISTGTFRPLVPAAFRAAVVRSLHNVHHPGVRATVRLVKASLLLAQDEQGHNGDSM